VPVRLFYTFTLSVPAIMAHKKNGKIDTVPEVAGLPFCARHVANVPAARAPLAQPAAWHSAAAHGVLQGTSGAAARGAARSAPAGAPPPGAGGPADCGRRASSSWPRPGPPPQRPRRPPPPPPPHPLLRQRRRPRRRPAQLGARAQQRAHFGVLQRHALYSPQVRAQHSAHLRVHEHARCGSHPCRMHAPPAAPTRERAPHSSGVCTCAAALAHCNASAYQAHC